MTEQFQAKKRTLSCKQELNASAEKVFPLLCPKREYDWIAPWSCEIIFSKSGFAELDCVFVTNFPDDVKETWMIDRYEPSRLIQFVRYSESRVIRYCIELTDKGNETTTASWTQTVISLNAEGRSCVDSLSEIEYKHEIRMLEKMLNQYLKTGKRLELTE
jgi:hypothetical protein